MLWEPHGPQGRVSALVNFRSPACVFGELKEEVCQGSANSGRELLPPAQLIQGDICSSIMISLPQGSSQWFRQHHHSHPAGCGPEIVSPVGTVGRSRAGTSRPAFPARCTFTWISPEVKSRCHQQGFLYSTRPTVPQGQHIPGASLLPGLILSRSKADLGCCAYCSPPLPRITESISCSILAGHCCLGIKKTLKHITASNLTTRRNKESVPCQLHSAQAHHLWFGDLQEVTSDASANSIISLSRTGT